MRIAFDGRTIVKGKSGVGNYAERAIRSLLDIDDQSEYFLFLVEPCENLEAPNLTKIIIAGYDKAGRNRYWENVLFPRFAAKHDIDLFFGPAYALPLLPRYGKFFQTLPLPKSWKYIFNTRKQIKYVVAIPDVIGIVHPETFTAKMRMWQRVFASNAAKVADAIITISESSKRDIVRLFPVDPAKIHVTPLSVDESFKQNHSPDEVRRVRTKYSLPDKYILFVGTIEPRKNVAGLATAYSLLPHDLQNEYKLVIAGSRGWYADTIMAEIDKLNISRHIRMLGFVDDKDLPVLLASANLFVFPSLYEGFGYPPLEAMASGVPVVTSITSSLPEVVGNAGVMVDPFDFRKISDEMTRILKDPNVASDYSRRGLERAKCFNWKATAEATLQVFQEVIARR